MKPTLTPRQAELLKGLPRDEEFNAPNSGIGNSWHWLKYKELAKRKTPSAWTYVLTPAGRALWDELNKPTREER